MRPQRYAKRATFPFINRRIIAVSATGDLALTLSVIESYISEMNLVNLATALHRLAKLVANNTATRAALQEHSVVAQLVHFANASLEKSRASGGSPQCQVLSNISSALATLQIPNLPLLEAIAELSGRRMAEFKSFERTATLWAFASFAEEGLPLPGKDALVRGVCRSEFKVSALLTLLQCLLTVQSKVAGIAVRMFFAETCRRVENLESGERQRLTYLCVEAELAGTGATSHRRTTYGIVSKCTISCEDLEMRCRNLSLSYAVGAQQEVKQLQQEQSFSPDQDTGQRLPDRLPDSDEVALRAVMYSRFNDAYQVSCNVEQRAELKTVLARWSWQLPRASSWQREERPRRSGC